MAQQCLSRTGEVGKSGSCLICEAGCPSSPNMALEDWGFFWRAAGLPSILEAKEASSNIREGMSHQHDTDVQQAWRQAGKKWSPLLPSPFDLGYSWRVSVSPSNNLVKKIPHRSSLWLAFSWFQIQSNWPPRITVKHPHLVSWHPVIALDGMLRFHMETVTRLQFCLRVIQLPHI